jgi:sulfate transport system ATP-binding protein
VVINHGSIEQVGSPSDLYDNPANDFVMRFIGPVTELGGRLVRPHDIELLDESVVGGIEAKVVRLLRVGFEVKAELTVGDGPEGQTWAQLTRGQAEHLDLAVGDTVWLRPSHRASTIAVA